ncbi:MAG: hypothetical protein HYX59_02650 [Elusimicrobia bacterium]|nr:hypothetical protein [Elusimicrobiota bacterium]
MKALFALFLLASPSWAGVVMPVENGVSPAGPSAPAAPVSAPGGGALGSPSLGSGADLRGAIPLLPSPVPGLLGTVKHFVGQADAAAAASIRPETAAVRPASGRSTAAQGRASDQTPALPAKASPGSPSLAISRDRKAAASTPDDGAVLTEAARRAAPSSPLADASSLEHARPEKAAGLGRAFFDQSDEKGRGALEDPSSSAGAAPAIAAAIPEGGMFSVGRGARGRLSPASAEAAFGPGHGPSRNAVDFAPEGETLQDAVASVPGAAAAGGASAVMFRSAAPNGRLPGAPAEASASAVPLPVLGAPRPLAIDRSPSDLVVRVRTALEGAMTSAPSAAASPRLAPPGPSTALLERGAMLEAFSVARAFAETVPGARTLAARSRSASPAAPLAPAAEPAPVPLWWAWLLLPLFVAAIRGIL